MASIKLPLDEYNKYWISETIYTPTEYDIIYDNDVGKWMLYYDKKYLNNAWILAVNLLRNNQLEGVDTITCSTSKDNGLSNSNNRKGVIIFFCHNSSDKDKILKIGKRILTLMKYRKQKYIFYKTNEMSFNGQYRCFGSTKNHLYYLKNDDLL